jgi:hypothetical protein
MRVIVISCLIFVSLSFQQCRTVEKTAVSCPEFASHKFNKAKYRTRVSKIASPPKPNLTTRLVNSGTKMSGQVNYKNVKIRKEISKESFSAFLPDKRNFLNRLTVSNNNSIALYLADCDTIFLKSGSWINAKIERKSLNRIKYRDCSMTGPVLSIPKSEIKSISYGNNSKRHAITPNGTKRIQDWVGVTGFIFSIAGLLFLGSLSFPFIGLILGGGVMGWISAGRIKDRPDKLKGRGLAEISIVLAYALLIFLVLFLVIILVGKIV